MKILIVEDDDDYRYLIHTALELTGIEVHDAFDVESALVAAHQLRPHAVLLDNWLPGQDGLEAMGRLRQASPGITVIMHTVDEERAMRMESHPAGPDAFVEKGLPPRSATFPGDGRPPAAQGVHRRGMGAHPQLISIDQAGGIAVLRMEHGKVNAQDAELLGAIAEQVDGLASRGAPPLVITGAGRAFSAGVDLTRFLEGGAAYVDRLIPALTGAFEAVFTYPGPTVAAVNGAAIAGGCILACACDRRLAAAGARIGASELQVGVAFPAAAIEILRHACGDRAEEVVLTGRLYEGDGAVAVGLAHEVTQPEALLDRAREVARELGMAAPLPYRLAKSQLRRPVLERIATDGPRLDAEVTAVWASEETAATVRGYMERTVRRG